MSSSKKPDPLSVYNKLKFRHFFYIMFVFVLVIAYVTHLASPVRGLEASWFLIILGISTVVHFLGYYLGYLHFRSWRSRVPFSIEGWDELVASLKGAGYYRMLTVEVVLKNSTAGEAEVSKVLKRYKADYNHRYHRSSSDGKDPRRTWEVIDPLTIKGTAGAGDIRRVKRMIEKYLKPIHVSNNCIEKVVLRYSKTQKSWQTPDEAYS